MLRSILSVAFLVRRLDSSLTISLMGVCLGIHVVGISMRGKTLHQHRQGTMTGSIPGVRLGGQDPLNRVCGLGHTGPDAITVSRGLFRAQARSEGPVPQIKTRTSLFQGRHGGSALVLTSDAR